MGNQASQNNQASAIYTKNYVSFIRDSLKIFMYCDEVLNSKDKQDILSLLKIVSFSEPKNVQIDLNLYQKLLQARKNVLIRFFEGAFLQRQCFNYTLHEYKYLQECIANPKKILSQPQINQIIQVLESDNQDNSNYLSELEKHANTDKQPLTFFDNCFFRSSSFQTIYLNEYHKQVANKINQQAQNQAFQSLQTSKDLEENNQVVYAAPMNMIVQDTRVQNLVITLEEFSIIQKTMIKNSHKISYVSQIPSMTLNLKAYLKNLFQVKEIQISSELDPASQREFLQFLQDNPFLEKLSANLASPIQNEILSTISNHPHLKYISLHVHSIDKRLKQIKQLKRLTIRSEMIYNVEEMINPQNIILQFEIKNIRFNQQVISILNKFPQVFLTCCNNFYTLAQTIFRDLTKQEQANLMKYFLKASNITIDSLFNLSQNEDFLRINNGTLDLKKGYLYLFMTKLLVDFERKLFIDIMKFLTFEIYCLPFMTFNPLIIYNDLNID
ncbi:hypothetical protein ABPG72_013697 [Tetrahymena utriculariae]